MGSHSRAPESRGRGGVSPRRTNTQVAGDKRIPWWVYVLIVLGVAVIGTVVILSLQSCGHKEPPSYVSPYDWSQVVRGDDGRFTYTEDGVPASQTGIDVSNHESDIDWKAVAGDGIDFAFVRIGYRGYTEGGIFVDDRFEANFRGARGEGLAVGVYFFSQATTVEEAQEEADFVIEQLRGRQLELPVVFDFESVGDGDARTHDVTREQCTANALAFCQRVSEAGYRPMVYMNLRDSSRYGLEQLQAAGIPIWYAQYDVEVAQAQFDFAIWQYSESASVAGAGEVDIDILFLTAPIPAYPVVASEETTNRG